jgi:hypothetical protein
MGTANDTLLHAISELLAAVRELRMRDQAQRSAWLLLARQLALRGAVDLASLEQDLRTQASAQDDAVWRAVHADLADLLSVARTTPSLSGR